MVNRKPKEVGRKRTAPLLPSRFHQQLLQLFNLHHPWQAHHHRQRSDPNLRHKPPSHLFRSLLLPLFEASRPISLSQIFPSLPSSNIELPLPSLVVFFNPSPHLFSLLIRLFLFSFVFFTAGKPDMDKVLASLSLDQLKAFALELHDMRLHAKVCSLWFRSLTVFLHRRWNLLFSLRIVPHFLKSSFGTCMRHPWAMVASTQVRFLAFLFSKESDFFLLLCL
jgi:hypothetical protein